MNVLSVHFVKQLFGQTYRANIIRNVSEEDFPFFGNISYKLFLFSTFKLDEAKKIQAENEREREEVRKKWESNKPVLPIESEKIIPEKTKLEASAVGRLSHVIYSYNEVGSGVPE